MAKFSFRSLFARSKAIAGPRVKTPGTNTATIRLERLKAEGLGMARNFLR